MRLVYLLVARCQFAALSGSYLCMPGYVAMLCLEWILCLEWRCIAASWAHLVNIQGRIYSLVRACAVIICDGVIFR